MMIPRLLKFQAIHQPGINKLVDYLLCNRPDPTELYLCPKIAQHLFWLWGRTQVDLFSSHVNQQLPCWFSRTGHLLPAAYNTLSQSWTGLSLFAYPF